MNKRWQDMDPIPDWGRCSRCGAPRAMLSHIYPRGLYCARSGHRADTHQADSLCGRRLDVFVPDHQCTIQDARRAYFDASRSLEENRPQ